MSHEASIAAPVEDSRTAVTVSRITRRCPGCGAAIEHGEEDGAVGCDFCGLRLAIGTGAGIPAYAVAARRAPVGGGAPTEVRTSLSGCLPVGGGASVPWLAEAKRALRTAGLRVRAMEPPRAILVPFHRMRAHTWQWYRATPGSAQERPGLPELLELPEPAGVLPLPPHEGETGFRLGVWDSTIDAVPSLELGAGTLSFRTQVLAWTPLADFLDPERNPGEDYAVLPAETGAIEAREQLTRRLSEGCRLPAEKADEQWILVTDDAQQLMHAPLLLCPFLGPQGRAAIILDGITFRTGKILAGDELARLETQETAARARPPDAPRSVHPMGTTRPSGADLPLGAGTLIPLSCPECSSPLPFLPRARVHRCAICRRHWTVRGDTLAPVPCVALVGSTAVRSAARAVFLPFYRLRGSRGEEWFVPAARGRNPRPIWNFALGLARRPRVWEEADFAIDAAVVEMTPVTASALAPFTARCLEQAIPAEVETELTWIAFQPNGPDLVEPGSGLGLPRGAFTPWEAPPRAGTAGRRAASPG